MKVGPTVASIHALFRCSSPCELQERRDVLGVPVHPAVGWSSNGAFWTIDSSKATPPHPEQTA